MKKKEPIQYTVRSIPMEVNEAVREYANQAGCSLNQAAIEVMRKGAGVAGQSIRYHDLDFMAASWVTDKDCDEALACFDQIEKDLWK